MDWSRARPTTTKRCITEAEIGAARTPAGGFSRESFAKLGVPYPPQKGWLKKLKRQAKDETSPSVVDEPIRIEFEEPITGLTLRNRRDAELALSVLAMAGVAVTAAEPELER